VANKSAYVDQGRVTCLPGNYDDFHRLWKAGLNKSRPETTRPASRKPDRAQDNGGGRKNAERKRAEARARNELYRRLKPLNDKLAKLEAKVEAAQTELDDLVARMVDPNAYKDSERWAELSKAHDQTKARVERLTAQWEELALKLEEAREKAEAEYS
jgi:ATP-binding cassette subfamily F protein 3